MKKIDPIILKGTRDFLPQEMMRRNYVMKIIQGCFEQFGYVPLETPILSPAETILGKYGEEGDRLTYSFSDRGGRKIALPYDLTVPFARYFAANYRNLPLPFKRYQIQRVWRAEKPQKGRLREFYQCDVDVIGSKSLICEAEIVKLIVNVFTALGLKNFKIRLNSRSLMNSILKAFGVSGDQTLNVIRIIDKIDKIGRDAVLIQMKSEGVRDPEKLLNTLTADLDNSKTLEKLAKYGTGDLDSFFNYCANLGVDDSFLEFDPTLARGLDYYTGLIFEVVSSDGEFGSICAGGRYDNLCGLFCDQDFSGIGVAFGFERIMLIAEKLNLFSQSDVQSKVLVTIFEEDLVADSLSVYDDLISASIAAEIYFEPQKIAKQFKYADQKKIPFVVLIGSDEKVNGTVTIKRMDSGKQKNIPREQLISYLNGFYEAK